MFGTAEEEEEDLEMDDMMEMMQAVFMGMMGGPGERDKRGLCAAIMTLQLHRKAERGLECARCFASR
eukprot:365622-Chlamydomonas_euryale.AAC.4